MSKNFIMDVLGLKGSFNKTVGLLLFIVLGTLTVTAEPLFDPLNYHTGMQLQSSISLNPAWIIRDKPVSLVRYSCQSGSISGDFHRQLEAGRNSDTYWTAYGTKLLGEKTLFSGSFAYRTQSVAGKMWSQNRQPYSGMPFVLADSSTGSWQLNGLIWNVEVSRELISDHLFGGLSVFYNVDESYKDIFPRPQDSHRDLMVAGSLGMITSGDARFGMMLKYSNMQESMRTWKYSLDQEKTPIFFKPRGLDVPLIFRGETSEERLYTIKGLTFSVDGSLQNIIAEQLNFAGNYGFSFADNVDGGAYPIDQGSWKDNYVSYSTDIVFDINSRIDVVLLSDGLYRYHMAEHPDFELEIFEGTERKLSAGGEIMFGTANGFRLSPSVKMSSQTLKRVDNFNGILDYFPGTLWRMQVGIELPEQIFCAFRCSFGSDVYSAREGEVYLPATTGFYYQTVTAIDELYYHTDYRSYRFAETLSFGKKQRYSLMLEYLRMMPENSEYFGNGSREQLNLNFVIENLLDNF